MQAVIFSEGDVFLDSCDFSGSSAAILLYAEGSSATSTVRNAVLGDNNCEWTGTPGIACVSWVQMFACPHCFPECSCAPTFVGILCSPKPTNSTGSKNPVL